MNVSTVITNAMIRGRCTAKERRISPIEVPAPARWKMVCMRVLSEYVLHMILFRLALSIHLTSCS